MLSNQRKLLSLSYDGNARERMALAEYSKSKELIVRGGKEEHFLFHGGSVLLANKPPQRGTKPSLHVGSSGQTHLPCRETKPLTVVASKTASGQENWVSQAYTVLYDSYGHTRNHGV